jgi:predicted RNA-binding protein Jag
VDRDTLMVHSMMQILEDFVKKERIDEIIDWTHDEQHRDARKKMDELINWFHNIYLVFDAWSDVKLDYDYKNSLIRSKENPSMYTMKPMSAKDRKKVKNIIKKENEMEETLNKKLHEILEIRKFLWT